MVLHRTPATLVAVLLLTLTAAATAANKSRLSTYTSGKPATGVSCPGLDTRSNVLMGGGTDVKAAFAWMIQQSRLCRSPVPGNLVVVRAGGNPDYDRFIYKLGELAAVQTVVVPDRDAANDPELIPYLRNASAIWITGGDQGVYYAQWKGTLLEQLIVEQLQTYKVPIGGTSAGMMLLSQFNYIASPYTISSAEALADPYKPGALTIRADFWSSAPVASPPVSASPALAATVTDSHFDTRDRMGRLLTFLARIMTDAPTAMDDATRAKKPLGLAARAIGVDQEAALLVECPAASDCIGRVVANEGTAGHAYVLKPVSTPTFTATTPKQIAHFDVDVYRLSGGDFNLSHLDSASVYQGYRLTIDKGVLFSPDQESLY